jgi:hypothetical protein
MQDSAAPVMFDLLGDAIQVVYASADAMPLLDVDGNIVLDIEGNPVWLGDDEGKVLTAVLEAPATTRETIESEEEDEKLRRTVVLSTDPDMDEDYGYLSDVEIGGTITINNNEVWGIDGIESRSPTFIRVICERWFIRGRDRVERQ